jgi:hypothetical protein
LGLLILKYLTSSLDSVLLLECEFKFQESLQRQQDECAHDSREYIIDEPFLLRNQILASTYLIGGPREKVIPQIELTAPIFRFPLPMEFTCAINSEKYFKIVHDTQNSISEFLDSIKGSNFTKENLSTLKVNSIKCLLNY